MLAYPVFIMVVFQEEAKGVFLSENNSSKNETMQYADASKRCQIFYTKTHLKTCPDLFFSVLPTA